VVQTIFALQVHQSQQEDILRWKPAQNEKCSSKSTYNHLHNLQEHTLPQQGARSISSSILCILAKVCKGKTIPPFLKTFVWRLLTRALVTADRAGRFSNHINKYCSHCGNTENDIHLFFFCDLPINIWSDQNINLPVHLIQPNDDIQRAVVTLLSNNHSEANLSRFFFLTWYIWKARNDERFQRKKWNYMQVIKVAEAHMNNHLSALEKLQPSNSSHQQTNPS
jgi:hypothetical protein